MPVNRETLSRHIRIHNKNKCYERNHRAVLLTIWCSAIMHMSIFSIPGCSQISSTLTEDMHFYTNLFHMHRINGISKIKSNSKLVATALSA